MIVKSGETRMKYTLPPLIFLLFKLIYKIDAEITNVKGGFQETSSNLDLLKLF